MNDQTDQELLRSYVDRKSDSDFATLVERHVDLVYSTALRMSNDLHSAKDITQCVFVALAQNARQLADRSTLAGWLHNTARNLAAKEIRSQIRRRTCEQEVAVMNELLTPNSPANWENIAPHLDEALGELNEPDRDAVLLRYFKNHDLRTVGATLGISDDAAQKRVSRAVERLREFFAKRGVTVGAGGLVVVISANAVQAAPGGLALTISTAAALTGTTLTTTATVTATKAIAMTALQKTVVTATIAILAGVGIYEARQASQLREQVQTLQHQQAPLTEQIQQLQTGFIEATNRLTSLRDENERLNRNAAELLKLRGEVSLLRNQIPATRSTEQATTNQMQFRYPYLPRESWSEKGTESPINTILTMFWALKQTDEARLEQLVWRLSASQTLDQLTFPKPDWDSISGVQILNTFEFFPVGGPQANVEVIFEMERPAGDGSGKDNRERDLEAKRWILTKTNNQWLIIGRR